MANRMLFSWISVVIAVGVSLSDPSLARAKGCKDCGKNSATVHDGIVFDELNVNGWRRGDGPAIMSAELRGVPVRLQVIKDELSAFNGSAQFRGAALNGLLITLGMLDGRQYELELTRNPQPCVCNCYPEQVDFWAAPEGATPAYHFMVRKKHMRTSTAGGPPPKAATIAGGPRVAPQKFERPGEPDDRKVEDQFLEHLCSGPYVVESTTQRPGEEHVAVVFEGDHYTDRHVATSDSKGWFNLACQGTASYKMHLLRHTTAGSGSASSPSWSERTAMLRAITADYCANGLAWTGDGTPLLWMDSRQKFPLSTQPNYDPDALEKPAEFKKRVEAVWGLNGQLLCLNEPRRDPNLPKPPREPSWPPPPIPCSAPAVTRASVEQSVSPVCTLGSSIPRCSDFDWSAQAGRRWSGGTLPNLVSPKQSALTGGYVVTVNPMPNPKTPPPTPVPPVDHYCNQDPPGVISWP